MWICKHSDVWGLGSRTVPNFQQEGRVSRTFNSTCFPTVPHHLHSSQAGFSAALGFAAMPGVTRGSCIWLGSGNVGTGWEWGWEEPSSRAPDDLGKGEEEGGRCKAGLGTGIGGFVLLSPSLPFLQCLNSHFPWNCSSQGVTLKAGQQFQP